MEKTIQGLLIDLDGTVYTERGPIPGALEALAVVRAVGLPVRFVTNTSRKPRRAVLEPLAGLGVEATQDEVLTAPVAATAWLRRQGARRVGLLVRRAAWEDFDSLELVGPEDGEPETEAAPVDHLVLGDLGTAWSFEILDWGFRRLLDGAALVAIQKNRSWDTGTGLSLDAGPFVAALEYATDRPATVVGKPSRAFFEAAVASMDLPPERCVMIGDDLESDVAGARAAGLVGLAVRTGKFRFDHRSDEDARNRADGVLDSLADLPAWLERR